MRRRYGIIGYPLSFTLSPKMHNRAFSHLGIDALYEAFPVAEVKEGVRLIKEIPLLGVSVTMPHKEAILEFLDHIDPVAEEIGAVNTILNREGRLYGFNTDWIGVVRALEEVTPLKGKRVLVLGAGGGARAACYALKEKGASLTVSSRTFHKAQKLALSFGGEAIPWGKRDQGDWEVVINATPLLTELPFPKEAIKEGMILMDMVYSPPLTPFLEEGQRRGAKVVSGLRMLLFQGVKQFEIWFEMKAPEEVMWEALKEGISSL